MKIRNGFVSNSSSSSFCIYGTCMSFSEIKENIKNSTLLTESYSTEEIEEMEKWDLIEIVEGNTDLYVKYYEGDIWIGREWTSIKDDETGLQFKENTKAEIEKLIGSDVKCSIYEETFYD